jgi:hypothetical protein
MNTELYISILVFLGALLAAVLFVLDRQGKRLSQSIPPELLPVLMGLLALAKTLAETTATPDDDALIEKLRQALTQPEPPAGTLPPIDPNALG